MANKEIEIKKNVSLRAFTRTLMQNDSINDIERKRQFTKFLCENKERLALDARAVTLIKLYLERPEITFNRFGYYSAHDFMVDKNCGNQTYNNIAEIIAESFAYEYVLLAVERKHCTYYKELLKLKRK